MNSVFDKYFKVFKNIKKLEINYQTIFRSLNRQKIDYIVAGGVAVNFHGIPRMTYDLDLMILLERENIERIISILLTWGYKPRAPVDPYDLAIEEKRSEWIKDKRMVAFNFYSDIYPIAEIDLIIDSPISYEKLQKRAASFDVEGESVTVISIVDLIELKLQSKREQDLSDVRHLKMILED